MTCTDEGCLYSLSCTKANCRKQYIGETDRAVYKRFKEQVDTSEYSDAKCPVGIHFQLPGHSKRDMEMIPLEIVRGCRATRNIRGRKLINKYQMSRHRLNTIL